MKVFMVPLNSLILYDLIERFGHEPLTLMSEMRDRVVNAEIEAPPLNLTPDDVKVGLNYAGIEIPSGIRGRMSIWGPLLEKAEAAIIMHDMPYTYGCVGCHRSNLLLNHLVRKKDIPLLEVHYPNDDDEAKILVTRVKAFLEGLNGN